MTDYGKPRNDKAQQDEQAHELIEQLDLLETVDRRITPEHVVKRFRQLLEDMGDDRPPSSAAEQLPHRVLGQQTYGNQLTGPWHRYNAEPRADLLGLSRSEPAIAPIGQMLCEPAGWSAAAESSFFMLASGELPTAAAQLTIVMAPFQASEGTVLEVQLFNQFVPFQAAEEPVQAGEEDAIA